MSFPWVPPPPPTLKINVHGTYSESVRPSGNDSGIGAIYRDCNGNLKLLTVGTIHCLTQLGNQLWAVFVALLRAYFEGYPDIVLETDNYEAYHVVKHFIQGAPTDVLETAYRIYTFNRPVGGVEELLNWDMGLGINHPDFQDVYLPSRPWTLWILV